MERILVDDVNNDNDGKDHHNDKIPENQISTRKKLGKARGWIFRSTIRCSTYRPSSTTTTTTPRRSSPSVREQDEGGGGGSDGGRDRGHAHNKGLTFHDFHLAMSIDVEASREELKQFLLKYIN